MWRFLLLSTCLLIGSGLRAQSAGQGVEAGLNAANDPASAQIQAFEAQAELEISDRLDALRWLSDPGPDPEMRQALETHVSALFIAGARWQGKPLKKWLQSPPALPEAAPQMTWQGSWHVDKRGGQQRKLLLSWEGPEALELLFLVELLPLPKSYGAEQQEVWEIKVAAVE